MSVPTFTPAQKAATLLENQILGLQNQVATQCARVTGFIANGIPAQGSNAAVTATDLQAALGSNLATIQAIIATLVAAVPVVS